jgi:hypothetical protein
MATSPQLFLQNLPDTTRAAMAGRAATELERSVDPLFRRVGIPGIDTAAREAGGGSIDQVTNVSLIRVSISFKHRRSRSFVSSVVSFPFFDVRRFIGGLKALSWVARFPFICFHW